LDLITADIVKHKRWYFIINIEKKINGLINRLVEGGYFEVAAKVWIG